MTGFSNKSIMTVIYQGMPTSVCSSLEKRGFTDLIRECQLLYILPWKKEDLLISSKNAKFIPWGTRIASGRGGKSCKRDNYM
uniref:Uncharacterized protein n=1 Tax=Arundo donax TaxID=35708 RepID=A0A0A9HF95_ARUDO